MDMRFLNNNLQILNEFDIDSSYLSDKQLQQDYYRRFFKTKRNYLRKLDQASFLIPTIKKLLKQNNMPPSFVYLAMAESQFMINVKSNKKAAGIWQFMPTTAKHFGLKVDRYIDERMDIVKSTQTAIKYLQYLHSMFGKWYLAAIAYNCGEGRIIEGITRATIDMYCEEHQCKNNSQILKFRQTIRAYQAKKVKFYEINKIYKTVQKWKYKPNIDYLLIEQKGLKRQYIPNESRAYIRKILSLAMMNDNQFFVLHNKSYLLNMAITDSIATVQVQGGLHLRNIASILNMSLSQLKKFNYHIKQNIIPLEKKTYQIYIPYSKLILFKKNISTIKSTKFIIYRVKKGDNLDKIAKIYKIDYHLIKKFNKLKSNLLKINQKLIIPVDPETVKEDKLYIVKRGDSLSKIAKIYKTSIKKLIKDNHIKKNIIKIGDKLVIKYH